MGQFTDTEKAAEARREVKMRRRVYPGWVAMGRQTQEQADRHIAIMDEIATEYTTRAEAERAKERML